MLIIAFLLLATCIGIASVMGRRTSPTVPLPSYFSALSKLAAKRKQLCDSTFAGGGDQWQWTMSIPDYGEPYARTIYDLTVQWKHQLLQDGGKIVSESPLAQDTFLHKGTYHCAVDYHGASRDLSVSVAPDTDDPRRMTVQADVEAK